jgi:hypothetical protein
MTPDELAKELELFRENILVISDPPYPKPEQQGNRIKQSIALAKQLEEATESIINAHKLYQEKGFDVEIRICRDTGLLSKWNLISKYPMRPKLAAAKLMTRQEFYDILNRLDDVFSSRDIQNALLESNIGPRRLQPTLGFIIKGMFGKPQIEMVNQGIRGPSVRYRKVK